jgi:hypothetical protein
MVNMSKKEKLIWIGGMIRDIESQIAMLQSGLQEFTKANVAVPAIQDLQKSEQQEEGKKGQTEFVKTSYSTAEDRWADPRTLPQ